MTDVRISEVVRVAVGGSVVGNPLASAETRYPTSDAYNSLSAEQWLTKGSSAGGLWAEIDEVAADDDTTYMVSAADNGIGFDGVMASAGVWLGASALSGLPEDLVGAVLTVRAKIHALTAETVDGYILTITLGVGDIGQYPLAMRQISLNDLLPFGTYVNFDLTVLKEYTDLVPAGTVLRPWVTLEVRH